MTDTESNKAVFLAFSEAWAAKDIDKIMDFVTDDMVYSASIGPEPGATYRGRDQVRGGIESIIAHDAATHVEITELHADGEFLFPLWSYTLADGSVAKGMDVIGFRDGLICRKDGFRKCLS